MRQPSNPAESASVGTGTANPTAALLVIGDEILSGRTQDTNTGAIARFLGALGIDLMETRTVRDDRAAIVAALNALRAAYTYVFTTGGIGPTHDDITADAVAAAFGVGIAHHPEAMRILAARYKDPADFNEARWRMARIPEGGTLIRNPVSDAPGFQIGNVFVMAGVPAIMQGMLEDVAPRLARGAPVHAATVEARAQEGAIAAGLARIQAAHRNLSLGSYPFYRADGGGTQLVVRGRDADAVEQAARAIAEMLAAAGIHYERL